MPSRLWQTQNKLYDIFEDVLSQNTLIIFLMFAFAFLLVL